MWSPSCVSECDGCREVCRSRDCVVSTRESTICRVQSTDSRPVRNPRDFFKPLAVGAPDPSARSRSRPSRMIHFFDSSQREDGRRRCPTSPRRPTSCSATSRTRSRSTARRPRARAWSRSARRSTSATRSSGRASTALESPVGARRPTTLVTEIGDKLDVIMVPKVEGAWDIHYVDRLLAQLEAKARHRAADPRPRDPRDRAGRRQPRGDRRRQPAHAGHELRPGRPRRLAPHEDDARRRRPPRLPRDRGPGPGQPRGAARERPAGPLALLDRAHGRRLHGDRDPAVLRPVRRHQGRRGLRGAVPRRVPARLRRRLVAAPACRSTSPRRSSRPTRTRSSSPRR